MNIWIGSDFHYGHKNIVRGESTWEGRFRDFDSLEEHNQTLVDNINKNVKYKDILYCLGDFSMGGKQNIYEFRRQLNVKTLHLILGNHCEHIRKNKILETDKGYINCQNLFTSVQEVLYKKISGKNMVLFHYPIASFQGQHKGAIHCFGHIHKSDFLPNDRSVNVCIDNHPEFRPFEISEIFQKINN